MVGAKGSVTPLRVQPTFNQQVVLEACELAGALGRAKKELPNSIGIKSHKIPNQDSLTIRETHGVSANPGKGKGWSWHYYGQGNYALYWSFPLPLDFQSTQIVNIDRYTTKFVDPARDRFAVFSRSNQNYPNINTITRNSVVYKHIGRAIPMMIAYAGPVKRNLRQVLVAVVEANDDVLSLPKKDFDKLNPTSIDQSLYRHVHGALDRAKRFAHGEVGIEELSKLQCMRNGLPTSMALALLMGLVHPIPRSQADGMLALLNSGLMSAYYGTGRRNYKLLTNNKGASLLLAWAEKRPAFKRYLNAYCPRLTDELVGADMVRQAMANESCYIPYWLDKLREDDGK